MADWFDRNESNRLFTQVLNDLDSLYARTQNYEQIRTGIINLYDSFSNVDDLLEYFQLGLKEAKKEIDILYRYAL